MGRRRAERQPRSCRRRSDRAADAAGGDTALPAAGRQPRSSACFRNRERRGERCDHRLRLGQSALGGQGVRARRARGGARPADRGDQRSRTRCGGPTAWCCPASAPSPIAGAGSTRVAGMVEALERERARARPAVPRHLRRHAAHGRARPRIRGDRRGSAGSAARSTGSRPSDPSLKIPHMGWNTLNAAAAASAARRHRDRAGRAARLFRAFLSPQVGASAPISSREADYGGPVTAIVGRDTMVGTQFHPEKSQRLGLR